MELIDLYRSIEEGEFAPTITDGVVKFYYRDGDYGVVPAPRQATEHYTEDRVNFTYPRSTRTFERTHESERGVADAMQTGWIIPLPFELFVHSSDSLSPVPETHRDNYVIKRKGNITEYPSDAVFHMNTRCIVDIPEGYSLLAISPCNYMENRFTVIPRILDAGEFPQSLWISLRIHRNEFTIDPGTPLLQVFPIKHSDHAIEATIGTFTEAEETKWNTNT